MPEICGVYVLYDHDEIVYIGKSKNVHRRILEHRDKEFTHFKIIEVDSDNYSKLERILIEEFFPVYNTDNETRIAYAEKFMKVELVFNLTQYGSAQPPKGVLREKCKDEEAPF